MNKKQYTDALRLMLNSRFFEEKTEELFKAGLIHGTTHLANGQEASQAGLCMALDSKDWIVPTHRCHGFTICKGSDPFKMYSEMFGSRYGLAKGLGGSMHMPDKEHCNLGSSAVVGSGVPLATGIAFYNKKHNINNISVAIFGDGASNRGSIHESMNIASIWNLPVLFYCENNHYGMSAPSSKMISIGKLSDRAKSYSIKGKTIDGNDVENVYDEVKKARSYILKNSKPFFLEVDTYRQKGHSKSDQRIYRTKQEEQKWLLKDPIVLFEKKLIDNNILDASEIKKEEEKAKSFIEECASKALNLKNQVLSENEALDLIFAKEIKL